jgi:hypothetical protein
MYRVPLLFPFVFVILVDYWKMAVPAEKKEEGPRRAPYKGLWAARGTAFRERQPKAAFQGKGVVSENQKTL